jgi:hypothetical protein
VVKALFEFEDMKQALRDSKSVGQQEQEKID